MAEAAPRAATGAPVAVQALLQAAEVGLRTGDLERAEALYRRALAAGGNRSDRRRRGDSPALVAALGLATVFQRQGRYGEAVSSYRTALDAAGKAPGQGGMKLAALKGLADLWKKTGRLDNARRCYEQALRMKPDAAVCYNLGNTLRKLGRFAEADAAYERALAIDPAFEPARLGRCIAALPVVYASTEEVLASRARYRARLEALAQSYAQASVERRSRAAASGFLQPFYLPYQGFDDRDLQQTYGEMVSGLMRARYPRWSHALAPRRRCTGAKLRVGFVSGYFFRGHSVWKIPLRGFVENLDRARFELFGYHTQPRPGDAAAAKPLFHTFVCGPRSVADWCAAIERDQLDALIFSDVGMDPQTLQLACLRLAPVQANAMAHPVTSGLPTVDYCLSSALMEPEAAERHYTEKLVRLPNLGFCYTPLPRSGRQRPRSRPNGEVVFWCAQSLFKYQPRHDDVFALIAQQVPAGRFHFIADSRAEGQITEQFRTRLRAAFRRHGRDADAVCTFLPHMTAAEFADACATADVFLDSIGWSGNNSTHEALNHDLPVVTLPGEMMRARHSLAILRMLGVEETIAADKDDYVRISVRLARDGAYRERVSQRIARNKHKLCGDLAPVRALEDFLIAAAAPAAEESGHGRDH